MKHRLLSAVTALSLIAGMLPAGAAVSAAEPGLLDASGFTVYDVNIVYIGADYLNSADVLFDDQDKVPASPDNTKVDTALWEATERKNWKPNWQDEFGDDVMMVDLGANYVVTGICVLDTNGVQTWTVEDGEPYGWETVTSFETDWYKAWRGITFEHPRETRWLRFTTPCGDAGVAELAIYGYKVSDLSDAQKAKDAPTPVRSKKTDLTAGQRIGFNAFIDDPLTAMMAGGNIREYHNFNWLYDDAGKVKFTQGTWGDMDSYYSTLVSRGISVIPCFQSGSSYITGKDFGDKPIQNGADPEDPASYALHAQAFYQVAARYGSNTKIDTATLHVADGSEPKVGMGLLDTLENSNEPNKTWGGSADFFTPAQMAAMCSADYDGHEGTIPNAGVKTADPEFKLAIGGLLNTASLIEYLDQMKLWFSYHRTDGQFAVDVLNVHMGPDTYNPEDSSFCDGIRRLQDWINANAPGMELWVSEFEIPMGDCEVEGKDAHDDPHYQLRYAQRVARTYLMAIGAGVDRMTKFQLRDEGEGVYYNSGLTTGKGEWSKKEAWYMTACMTQMLKNADFVRDASDSGVCDYVFLDRASGEEIHCLWSPTSEGKTIADHALSAGNAAYAYLTTPGMYAEGVTEALAVKNGSVTLDVTETPVFVRFSGQQSPIINGRGMRIPNLSVSGEEGTIAAMFDEQDTMPKLIYGDTKDLAAPETPDHSSGVRFTVQLDRPYVLTGFGVYDTYGTGSVEVYDAETMTLLWSTDLSGYMCRSMSLTEDSAPTEKLLVVRGGGELNELAFYGYPAPEISTVQFDVTNDGVFNALDVVALQKWLVRAGTLANPSAADADGNGVTDIFDLARMKHALIS